MNSQPPFLILTNANFEMVILSKEGKPDNFKSHNALKFGFANPRSLWLNFVGCESFLEPNPLTYLLYMRQTWMTRLILAISLCVINFL